MARVEGSRSKGRVKDNLVRMLHHGSSSLDSRGRHKAQHQQQTSCKRQQGQEYL